MSKLQMVLTSVLLLFCFCADGWADELKDLEQKAAAGDAHAGFELAKLYFEANVKDPDTDKIYPLLIAAAEKMHNLAFQTLFMMPAMTGKPIPLSTKQQDALIDRGLSEGDDKLWFTLAKALIGGFEKTYAGPINPEKGIQAYLQKAEKAYKTSPDKVDNIIFTMANDLEIFIFRGEIDKYEHLSRIVETELQAVNPSLQLLIKKYLSDQFTILSSIYNKGDEKNNIPVNHEKEVQWYVRAADLGSNDALLILIAIYLDQKKDIPADYRKGLESLSVLKTSRPGLIQDILEGNGLPPDMKPERLLNGLIENDPVSMFLLGRANTYLLDKEKKNDKSEKKKALHCESILWLTRAATAGNRDAQGYLALLLMQGNQVAAPDYPAAYRWARTALENKDELKFQVDVMNRNVLLEIKDKSGAMLSDEQKKKAE